MVDLLSLPPDEPLDVAVTPARDDRPALLAELKELRERLQRGEQAYNALDEAFRSQASQERVYASRIQDLETLLAVAEESKADFRRRLEELLATTSQQAEQLDEAATARVDLEARMLALVEERDDALRALEALQGESSVAARGVQEELERTTAELERTAAELERTAAELETQRGELADAKGAEAELREALLQKTELLATLEAALLEADRGRTAAEDQCRQLEGKLVEADAQRRELEEQLVAAEAQRRELEEKLVATGGPRRELEAKLVAADGQRRALGEKLVAAEEQRRELEAKLLAGEQRRRDLEEKLASAISELGDVDQRVAAAEAETRAARAAISGEVARRTERVKGLVQALEPFAWGLGQALEFVGQKEGGESHKRTLALLLKTIEKLNEDVRQVDVMAAGDEVDIDL